MTLASPPSKILLTHLIAQSVFTDPDKCQDWPIYKSWLPDGEGAPNNAAAIYDTAGLKDGRLMSGPHVFHHGIQIRVRSRDDEEAWTKITAAHATMEAINQTVVTVGGVNYTVQNASIVEPPLFAGYEESGTRRRLFFVLNLLVSVKQT